MSTNIQYTKNRTFIFIPFLATSVVDSPDSFHSLFKCMNKSDDWNIKNDKLKYFFRYISDKFDLTKDDFHCFHAVFEKNGRSSSSSTKERLQEIRSLFDVNLKTKEHIHMGEATSFCFTLEDIHLYMFSTLVGILAFEISFPSFGNNPYYISSALFHLKKVARETFHREDSTNTYTLLELSKSIMSRSADFNQIHYDFFFHVHSKAERANYFSYLEVYEADNKIENPKYNIDEYYRILYYMRNAFHSDFIYDKDIINPNEIHTTSNRSYWGISQEAAVCLTAYNKKNRKEFIDKTFYPNFRTQYLFMYLLLLHQKYVLYRFLTKIDKKFMESTSELEKYSKDLLDFEINFNFSVISEVPQYQILYQKIKKLLALNEIYQDINEPIETLRERRQEESENQEKESQRKMDGALTFLALLGIFSALVDSFDFFDEALNKWGYHDFIHMVQIICIVVIIVVAGFTMKHLKVHHMLIDTITRYFKKSKRFFHSFFASLNNTERKYSYIGFFVDREELMRHYDTQKDKHSLDKKIEYPHITFAYRPDSVDLSLLGKTATVKVTGYGYNDENEGYRVELSLEDKRLKEMYNKIKLPHITLSISNQGQAKNTCYLSFHSFQEPMQPFEVKATFGVAIKKITKDSSELVVITDSSKL